MESEQTLSIIKPDAVKNNVIGEIISRFERKGLKVVAAKILKLSKHQAEQFYKIHQDRPFYSQLVQFMSSGPVFVQVLEGDNAVKKNREIMGDTDPKNAKPGTIRKDFAKSIDANAIHGSDSKENAANEIDFFFSDFEIFPNNK